MRREHKVISLDLAKEIDKEHKRLGIEVESEGWWIMLPKTHTKQEPRWVFDVEALEWENKYPSYDTAELGEMLVNHVDSMPKWFKTEAEARGRMYLRLLKEGCIK